MFDLRELENYGLVAADLDIVDVAQAREDIRLSERNISLLVLKPEGSAGGNPHILLIATPEDMRWILREWCFDEDFIEDFLEIATA